MGFEKSTLTLTERAGTQKRPVDICPQAFCNVSNLDEDALERGVDGVLGDETNDLLGDLAALED